jgi:hypothetical protein
MWILNYTFDIGGIKLLLIFLSFIILCNPNVLFYVDV